MPVFRYQVIDEQGRALSGPLEAADAEAARAALVARGWQVEAIDEAVSEVAKAEPAAPEDAESQEGGRERLGAEEAFQLVGAVAELTQAGLPLPAGLYAMASEVGSGRLARALRTIARRMERGESLDAVLLAEGERMPADLRGLLVAAVRSGQVSESLQELLLLRDRQSEITRRVWLASSYPLLLVVLTLGLCAFFMLLIVPEMRSLYTGFEMQLPETTHLVLFLGGPGMKILGAAAALVLAVGVLVWLLRGRPFVWRTLVCIPVYGPLWRFCALSVCCRLLALFVRARLPLPEALQWVSAALRDRDLAEGCRAAAQRVEAGRTVTHAFCSQRQFPPGLTPMVDWGDRESTLADAFTASAEVYEGRALVQARLLEAALPPLVFLFVVVFVVFILGALFMPLIGLIQRLT